MKTLKALFLEIFSVLLLLPALTAAAPALINYQGRLVDASGNPLSGTYSLTFRIYDASSAGTLIWNETQSLSLDNGIFSASLGASTALAPSVFSSDTRYLEVQVGADSPMTPRIRLQSVPYAIYAASAAYAVGSDIADGQVTDAKIVSMAASKLTGALPAIDGSALLNVNSGSIVLPIVSTHVATGGIIAANIAADAVTTVKILDANVTSAKLASAIDAAKIGGGLVSTTKFDYLSNITSDVQAQINGKLSGTATISPTLIDLSTVTAALAGKLASNATVSPSLIDLSTVTAALAAKLDSGASISPALINLSTVTTALSSKLDSNTTVSPALINLSTVTTALAAKLDNNATVSPALINLSTVTTALSAKLDNSATVSPTLIDLSTVTTALSGKLATNGNGSALTALTAANISAGSLGAGVIASSIAVNSVYTFSLQDASITKAKIAADTCVNGQILKLASGVWSCGTDDTGAGGTVTGSGLAGQVAYWSGGSSLGTLDYLNARVMLGLTIGTSVQAYDADLTAYAGVTPSANILSLLGSADYATARTNLGLGTMATKANVADSDISGVVTIAHGGTGGTTYTGAQIQLGLVPGTSVQAYDADLDDLADGSLTGSKVGTGVPAANIANGVLGAAVTHAMGAGAGVAKSIGVANVNTGSQATTGTSEEVLLFYSLPLDSLSADGKGVKIRAWGTTAANANAKVASIRFGGIGGTILVTATTSISGDKWELEALLFRTGVDTQESIGRGTAGSVPQPVVVATPAQDDGAAIDIALTGTTVTSAADLTAEGLIVEFIN